MELLNIFTEGKCYQEQLYNLYEEAFPPEEKKPVPMMEEMVRQGLMEMLAVSENGEFIGLAINMFTEDMALLDYFAIEEGKRDGGYGSRAVKLLMKRFEGKPYIFEVEKVDDSAPNGEERARRMAFYLRNGLKKTGVEANVYKTDFTLLTPDGSLTYEQYIDFLKKMFGEEGLRILEPKKL